MKKLIKYIDIGNTHTKILEDDLVTILSTQDVLSKKLPLSFNDFNNLFVISSVVPAALNSMEEFLCSKGDYIVIDKKAEFSFKHDLKGVGVDRLLAVEGALSKFKSEMIVIDAGTAITIDFVGRSNDSFEFKGGFIVPGFNTTLRSLSQNTSQLPEFDLFIPEEGISRDTVSAINSGICLSISYGIQGLIKSCGKKHMGAKRLVITGGMGIFLYELIRKYPGYLEDYEIILENDLIFLGMKNIMKNKEVQQ